MIPASVSQTLDGTKAVIEMNTTMIKDINIIFFIALLKFPPPQPQPILLFRLYTSIPALIACRLQYLPCLQPEYKAHLS